MPAVVPLLPPHKHFVSVFGGSGAEILCKPRSHLESFNDINCHIYNIFSVIRDGDVDELKRRIRATPDRSRQVYDDARAVLAQPTIRNPIQSAWAYLVVSHQGFCSTAPPLQRVSNWGYLVDGTRGSTKWEKLPSIVDAVRRRFQHVQLFTHPWTEMLRRLDHSDTCFLLDPPYFPETLSSAKSLYVDELTCEQHVEMLETLNRIRGKALVFNYDNPVYNKALKHWRREKFKTWATMGMAKRRSPRTEVLWIKK